MKKGRRGRGRDTYNKHNIPLHQLRRRDGGERAVPDDAARGRDEREEGRDEHEQDVCRGDRGEEGEEGYGRCYLGLCVGREAC